MASTARASELSTTRYASARLRLPLFLRHGRTAARPVFRGSPGGRFGLLIAGAVFALCANAAPAASRTLQDIEACTYSQGYWSTHPGDWPVNVLVLGDPGRPAHTYGAAALLALLRSPVRGDASINLAQQLIAAKLNVEAGASPGPIAADLTEADRLLGAFTGSLPFRVPTRTPVGSAMTAVAARLEAYNRGEVAGSCGPTNHPPRADAGPDQTVPLGATVALTGAGSTDPDGQPLTFRWAFVSVPAGSGAVLAGDTTVSPTFVVDLPGRYEVRLVVNDGGLDSAPDTVVVSTLNSAPTADAGSDQTAPVGTVVTLTGAGSTDPDGDALTYSWSFASRPESSQAVLSNPTAVMPTFAIDAPGAYVVQLVVSDGALSSAPDTVTISTVNSAPVAHAGEDVTGVVGALITLNGTASSDVDGDPLTYRWAFVSRPEGSVAALDDETDARPSFTIDRFGEYVVQLIVNDGTADSPADTVVVGTLNSPPVAHAGPDQQVIAGAIVELDGGASSDVDGQTLTYAWSIISAPQGIIPVLSDSSAVRPTFPADLPGVYVAQLVVNDGTADSTPDTVSITADPQQQNRPPTADAGPDQTVNPGSTVLLDGSASSDPDNDPLGYQWSLSRPDGSSATLSATNVASPNFVADVPGSYVAQLIVNDGTVNSDPDSVTISTSNTAPVANAGPDQRVARGATVQLDGSGSLDADGTPLSFAWTMLSRPAGSTAALLPGNSVASPTFTADVVGDYVIQLIVNDGLLDSAPDTVVVTAALAADLRFVLTSSPSPALGSTADVGFYLYNDGPAAATGVTASIPIPAGTVFSHYADSTGGTYNSSTGIWTIPGTFASGSFRWIVIVVRVQDPTPGALTASVATSDQFDPNPGNNSASATLTPNTSADLQLSIFSPPTGTITPGSSVGPFGLFFQVYNPGPALASNVALTFHPPAGFTVTGSNIGANVYPGDYTPSTGVWNIGTLPAFAAVNLILSAIVNPTGPTGFDAAVTSTSPDPAPSNNVVTVPPINRPPVASAGANRTVGTYETVTLDGSGSTDPEGDPLTLQWSNTLRPMSSNIVVTGANTTRPTFTPDQRGTYVFRLTANDGRGGVHASLVTITAEERNQPPVIRSAPVTAGAVGVPYRYAVHATDPDAEDTLTFSLVAAPAGMTIDPPTGIIDWIPGAAQAGPQAVEVRVQDAAGRFVTQAYSVQVSSSANGAPVAADDAYEVRAGESLSVNAAGVLQNDTDESPLSAALVRSPSNGTVALSPDGSFTYTPYTQRPGELVIAQGINLATRLPGVSVSGTPGICPQCLIDDDPTTTWISGTSDAAVQMQFPQDVTVSEVRFTPYRTNVYVRVSAGILTLLDAQGNEIYNSGNVELPAPEYYGRLVLPGPVSGVRRVRFVVTNGDQGGSFNAVLNEMQVMGSALLARTAFVETNLAQRLATTVRASSYNAFNVPEAVNDDTLYNWYAASSNPGEFIEIAFHEDVTVSGLRAGSAGARPDGLNSSLGFACSGNFRLHAADGTVLWDSGLVNHPSTLPNQNIVGINYYTPSIPSVSGVRSVRYELAGCTAGSAFPAGFSEIKVFGTPTSTAPAFSASKKLHTLLGREVHSTPLVVNLTDDNADGLINTDDVPDIVAVMESTTSQLRGEIKVVSGDDGRVLFTAGGPNLVSPWSELAAADIDGDGRPEIVAVHADGNRLIAFEDTGEQKWLSDVAPLPTFNLGGSIIATGAVSIANLNATGPPEIIVGKVVFDATGRLVGNGTGSSGGTGLRTAISAVADIDLDGTPELVAGPTAYRLGSSGLSVVWQRTDRADGFAGIGNFDDDPEAEIAMVANGFVYLLNHDGTDAEVWNPPTLGPVDMPGDGQGGAPLVADVDGDGWPEIGVAGDTGFIVYNRDGSVRWRSSISDRSSNSTGSVAFDLDGDGTIEIIYRDEFFLRIYRGADGHLLEKIPVSSATWGEIPTVADVDNDGHADIVVSSDLMTSGSDTGVIVINDVLNLWKRTRRVWNQHAYHVTNVNEDGTIPAVETPHWLVPGLNGFRTNAFGEGEAADAADAFTYVARDGVLQSNEATVRITVRPVNAAPHFTSTAITSAAQEVAYTYPARAADPDAGDILTFSLPTAPSGMAIDPASGFIRWTPTSSQQGDHAVVVRVEDVRGLFALQGYTVQVGDAVAVPNVVGQPQATAEGAITAATLAVGAISSRHSPTVAAGSVISQSPAGGALVAAGAAVSLVVSIGPAPTGTVPDVVGQVQPSAQADILAAQFTVGTVTGQNSATVPAGIVMAQTPEAGTIAATGSPIALLVSFGPPPGTVDVDLDGFTGDMGDCNDTNAAINPGALDPAGDGIDQNCNGVDSIVGDISLPAATIASPADLAEVTMPTDVVGTATDANFLRYTLQLSGVDDDAFRTIGSGTTPVVNGVLGRVDPTLLENGLYRVRLVAEDVNGQTTVDERVYRVEGEAKVGNFRLSFTDLSIPVGGIPITVLRTYDSRVKSTEDFGIGWTLDVARGSVQHNRVPGRGWQILPGAVGFPCTTISETATHLTQVRLSDFESYTFAFMVSDPRGLTGGCEATAEFRFLGGRTPDATLEIPDNRTVLYLNGTNEVVDPETFLPFDPKRLRLTLADGRVIDLERLIGMTRIEMPTGDALTISRQGILHSSGKSIAFERDVLDRIARITDPMGHVLEYAYDERGDLVGATDQERNTTTFSYDDRHHLVEIVDPLGNRAVRSEYDSDGRLIAVIDPNGHRTTFTHDITGRLELIVNRLGAVSSVEYDERGNVVRQIDALGHATTFAHDEDGNPTAITNPAGETLSAAYTAFGRPLTITNPLGAVTAFSYNSRGQVVTDVDARGNETTTTYDSSGNPTSTRDALGHLTTHTYERGRRASTTDPLGNVTVFRHDASGLVVGYSDALGVSVNAAYDANGRKVKETRTRTTSARIETLDTSYYYDARGRLVATVLPDGSVARTRYDALGQKIATVDQLGRETNYEYDVAGNLIRTNYPDGTQESAQFDAESRRVTSTDRQGRVTQYAYDTNGQPLRTTAPDGTSVGMTYDESGRIRTSTDARGNVLTLAYDAAGRTQSATDALGNTTTFSYDAAGNHVATRDARGNTQTFEYDAANRRVLTRFPDGTTVRSVFDARGQVTATTDQTGSATRYEYDALGRLTATVDALGQRTTFAYDELGNRIQQVDGLGRVTRFEFDARGRQTRRTLPLGASEWFAYDAFGNVVTRVDFGGMATTYLYDESNRLRRKTPDPRTGEPPVSFTYDPSGRPLSMTDATGTTTLEYDIRGRLVRKATPQGELTYGYDTGGNVTSVRSSNPNGTSVDYQYDQLNRLSAVIDNRIVGGATTYRYDAGGNLEQYAYPNGVETVHQYDTLNRLTTMASSAASVLASFSYTLGPVGNRLSVSEASGRTVTYSYDTLFRLTGESITSAGQATGAVTYTYDAVGNRVGQSSSMPGVPTVARSYDALDRLTSDSHDANGNTVAFAGRTLSYDFENRLTGVPSDGVQIGYDAAGQRVSVTEGGVTTRFLIDDLNPTGRAQVLEEVVEGVVQRVYTYGLGLISQRRIVSGSPAISFYGYDGRGSVRYLTDASGAVTDRYDYDAFGVLIRRDGVTPNNHLFNGEYFDPSVNAYHLRARYYQQGVGRFLSRDPMAGSPRDPRSMHPYLYAHANPVNISDPLGLFSLADAAAAVGVASTLSAMGLAVINKRLVGGLQATYTPDAGVWGASVGWSGGALVNVLASQLAGIAGAGSDGSYNPLVLPQMIMLATTMSTGFANAASGSANIELVGSTRDLKAGTFVGYSPSYGVGIGAGTICTSFDGRTRTGKQCTNMSLNVYSGAMWNVDRLESYRGFPVPSLTGGLALYDGQVGGTIAWVVNPLSSPPQFGQMVGVSVATLGHGASFHANVGMSWSAGPSVLTAGDRNNWIFRASLLVPWPPFAAPALALKAYGVNF